MASKRPKPEEIVTKLRQVEVLTGQGMPRLDAIRQISVTEQTYYRWRKNYGGMGTEQLKELKRLQKENERLRRAVSVAASVPANRSLQFMRFKFNPRNSTKAQRLKSNTLACTWDNTSEHLQLK